MTTLDPGGPHVDGRDMLIAELEDRLTAAQGEIRRLRSDYEARGSVIESLKREVTQVSLVARRTADENDELVDDLVQARRELFDENDKLKAELAAEKNRTAAAIARNARLWARLEAEEAENRRLLPVVEAAKAWREAESASPYLGAPPELVDLIAAVDALGTDAATSNPNEPKLTDLVGIDPNFTDGLDTKEYLRQLWAGPDAPVRTGQGGEGRG